MFVLFYLWPIGLFLVIIGICFFFDMRQRPDLMRRVVFKLFFGVLVVVGHLVAFKGVMSLMSMLFPYEIPFANLH